MPEVDFGFGGGSSGDNAGATGGQAGDGVNDINNRGNSLTPPDINDDNNGNSNDNNGAGDTNGNNGTDDKGNSDNSGDGNNNAIPHDYEAGTEIEVDGSTYSVAENGDILDKDGNVFKEAKDVKEWVASFEIEDTNPNEINIENLQKTFDVELTDENGKPIEFENTPDGVKAYVESIIEVQKKKFKKLPLILYMPNILF